MHVYFTPWIIEPIIVCHAGICTLLVVVVFYYYTHVQAHPLSKTWSTRAAQPPKHSLWAYQKQVLLFLLVIIFVVVVVIHGNDHAARYHYYNHQNHSNHHPPPFTFEQEECRIYMGPQQPEAWMPAVLVMVIYNNE